MEGVRRDIDCGELGVWNFDGFGILPLVQLGTNLEAGLGCRCGDQLDDGPIAAQGLAPPVDGDEREETMLDLIPLAGAGRQVADRDGQFELVGQLLKLDLPQTHAITVAATAVGGDHQA